MSFGSDLGPCWLPKCLPFGTPWVIKIGQKIDRKLDCSKCHRKIAPRSPKTPPRASQELPRAPKTAPRHPKMLPRGPAYSQERLQTAPQAHGNGIARRASSFAFISPSPLFFFFSSPPVLFFSLSFFRFSSSPLSDLIMEPRARKNSAAGTWERDRQTCFLVCLPEG